MFRVGAGQTPRNRARLVGSRIVDSDRSALWQAGLGFIGVVGASVVVGYVGSHDESFSWELAAIFGTALGTTGLAAATYWLASSTRTEVRATQQLAELTRSDQAARELPVVVLEWIRFQGSPRNGRLEVFVRNVGLGPALRIVFDATYSGHDNWQPFFQPFTMATLAPGEGRQADILLRFPEPFQPDGVNDGAFDVSAVYLDRSRVNTYEMITGW